MFITSGICSPKIEDLAKQVFNEYEDHIKAIEKEQSDLAFMCEQVNKANKAMEAKDAKLAEKDMEIERLKKGASELSAKILSHLANETDFSDDLALQSLAIHVKEDLCK
jgi:uncharacterized protein YdcH (DUF465 family)